jgi:hypothetical protein
MLSRITLASTLCAIVAGSASSQIGLSLTNGGTTNPSVEVPYHATLLPTTGLTVEAWITYDGSTLGTGNRWPCICRQNVAPNSESFVFRVDAASIKTRFIKLAVRTTAGFQSTGYSFALGELKKWTHVAGTFDGQNIKFFVNGVEKSKYVFTTTTTMNNTGGVLRIGNGDTAAAGAETWNGEIDELRLWPYARTAAEIKSTMNLALSSVPGEVSTWNLDFTPKDSSGGNDGKDVATPTYNVNSLRLTAVTLSKTFGNATAGCAGTPAIGVTGTANIGNSAFGVTCVHAAITPGGIGFIGVNISKLTTSIKVGAANLWINPVLILGVPLDANGLSKFALPIPNDNTLINKSIYVQEVFGQTGCAIDPFATSGLTITIIK